MNLPWLRSLGGETGERMPWQKGKSISEQMRG